MKKILKYIFIGAVLMGISATIPYAVAIFSNPLTVVNSGAANSPSVGVDSNGIVYAVWAEFDYSWIQRDVYLKKSTDGGATFPSAKNISNSSSVDSRNVKIFIDSGNKLHIIWEEDDLATGSSDIVYVQSNDGGATFTAIKNISANATQSVSPSIVVDDVNNNNVFIAWADETTDAMQIFLVRSVDDGINFSSPVNISNTVYNTDNPELGFRHDGLHLVWQSEDPQPGIFYTKSTDDGASFSAVKNISNNTIFATYNPHLDFSTSTHIHIVWTEYNANEPEIMYSRSVDSGSTFELPQVFSQSPDRVSEKPSIYVKSNKVYVFWAEDVCDADGCVKRVYRRFSANDGQAFSAPSSPLNLQVFKAAEESDVSVFGTDAYVLWQQQGNILFTKGQ